MRLDISPQEKTLCIIHHHHHCNDNDNDNDNDNNNNNNFIIYSHKITQVFLSAKKLLTYFIIKGRKHFPPMLLIVKP